MAKGNTISKKPASMTGDEVPIELRIVCAVTPGDEDTRPKCRVADEELDFDDEQGDLDEGEEKISEIHKLRRKENKGESDHRAKKKHEEEEDSSDDDSDESDEDEDDETEIFECVQKSTMRKR